MDWIGWIGLDGLDWMDWIGLVLVVGSGAASKQEEKQVSS
jgi:hypothetical protein